MAEEKVLNKEQVEAVEHGEELIFGWFPKQIP